MAWSGKIRERFGKNGSVWKRIFALSKSDWAVLALVGVLLLVIAMPTGKSAAEGGVESKAGGGFLRGGSASEDNGEQAAGENTYNDISSRKENTGMTTGGAPGGDGASQVYAAYLEKRLEAVLAKMDGVGQVKVMVTVSDAGESVVEKDVSVKGTVTSESDSAGGSRTVSENSSEEQTIYVESGNGSTPYIQKEKLPTVEGVVVVAEGAGSSVVISNISESVQALLPVEAHRIKVVKMCSKEE